MGFRVNEIHCYVIARDLFEAMRPGGCYDHCGPVRVFCFDL